MDHSGRYMRLSIDDIASSLMLTLLAWTKYVPWIGGVAKGRVDNLDRLQGNRRLILDCDGRASDT